eukprot:g3298.t1
MNEEASLLSISLKNYSNEVDLGITLTKIKELISFPSFVSAFRAHWGLKRLLAVITSSVDANNVSTASEIFESLSVNLNVNDVNGEMKEKIFEESDLCFDFTHYINNGEKLEEALSGDGVSVFLGCLDAFCTTRSFPSSHSPIKAVIAQLPRSRRLDHEIPTLVFPSAVILSRFLCCLGKPLLAGKSVLELGAGLGLCGFIASAVGGELCERVVITDRDEVSLKMLQRSLMKSKSLAKVAHCDWADLPDISDKFEKCCSSKSAFFTKDDVTASKVLSRRFDLILCSEIIHEGPAHAKLAFCAIAHFLKPGGLLLMSNWGNESTHGIETFHKIVESEWGNCTTTVKVKKNSWLRSNAYSDCGFGKDYGQIHELSIIKRPPI